MTQRLDHAAARNRRRKLRDNRSPETTRAARGSAAALAWLHEQRRRST